MDTAVDVLVTVQDVKEFRGLLATLDVQTLPADAYRVVAVADGLDAGSRDLLDRLAGHRPNVVVADTAPQGATQATATLPLRESERLAADALELLLAAARDTGAGVVVGKAVATTTAWDLFAADHVAPGAELADVDVSGLPVLVTGDLPAGAGVADVRRAAVDAASQVAVVASSVVLLAAGRTGHTDATEHRVVDVEWRDGVLELRSAEGGIVRALVGSLTGGHQWPVPAADESGTLVRIDLRTAALGRPLPTGGWLVDLQLAGDHTVGALPRSAPRSALLEVTPGTASLVVVAKRRGQLVIDVGAGRWLPSRLFQPAAARITESARGTLLEWPLPVDDFTTGASVKAGLRIGSLPFIAEVVSTDGEVLLRSWLSGLPAVRRLAVRVGGSAWRTVPAELVIDNVGGMTIQARSRAGAEAPAAKAADHPSGVSRVARGVGRRLRPGRSS
ncbi:hypothetical protein [Nocardioides conyzicola]|uniref:Uncharacterized protein n=1 Tax=Nocardioides conyzicola TaxID=1651781 RepID=A0ABP8X987_9ACTN